MLPFLALVITIAGIDPTLSQRHQMVDLIAARGVSNAVVLSALRTFPRHELVPPSLRQHAYEDRPLPIGEGQTISQPYIVAVMTEAADAQPGEKVLEVGTGSGYQAAILATVGARVFTIEIIEDLARRAERDLQRLGVQNVSVRHGDGYAGWPEEAPFDAILVTAAPENVPHALRDQLIEGGRLVIPLGSMHDQTLEVHERRGPRFDVRRVFPVRFVPMTGKPQ